MYSLYKNIFSLKFSFFSVEGDLLPDFLLPDFLLLFKIKEVIYYLIFYYFLKYKIIYYL